MSDDSKDSITRLDGSTISRNDIVEQSIAFYNEKYDKELTDVCDFSVGSEIRTLHESIAVELMGLYRETYFLSKQKFINTATGFYLDLIGCELGLTRKGSAVATGTVTFTVKDISTADYTVPAGTIILGRNTGYEYILDTNCVISAGTQTVDGRVHSKITGARYNSPAHTLTAFQEINNTYNEVSVTNNSAITGGVDAESDNEFRARLLTARKERAWGTVTSYKNLIMNEVTDVHDLSFVSPTTIGIPPHYVTNSDENDESKICTECDRIIYVNAFSKPCPDETRELVEYVMTLQDNLVIGHLFHVEKAELIPVYLQITVSVSSYIEEEIIADHIEAYLNGDTITTKYGETNYEGLNIGQALYKSNLYTVIESIPGIDQVTDIYLCKYSDVLPPTYDDGMIDNNTGVKRYLSWIAVNSVDTTTGKVTTKYKFEDDDGFAYYDYLSTAYTSSSGTAYRKGWGVKNFNYIIPSDGYVFSLGQRSDVDEDTDKIFRLIENFTDVETKYIDGVIVK